MAASSVPSVPQTRWRFVYVFVFVFVFFFCAKCSPNQVARLSNLDIFFWRSHIFLSVPMNCLTNTFTGSSAKIWNAEGGSGLQQMLYLLHVSFAAVHVKYFEFMGSTQKWSLFVKTQRADIKTFTGTLTRREQRMHTMCTAAPTTAAGDTRGWSPKKESWSWSWSPGKSSTTETTYSL